MNKTYLGDGVYIELQEGSTLIKITTSDGIMETNKIFMDIDVINNFKLWLKEQSL